MPLDSWLDGESCRHDGKIRNGIAAKRSATEDYMPQMNIYEWVGELGYLAMFGCRLEHGVVICQSHRTTSKLQRDKKAKYLQVAA